MSLVHLFLEGSNGRVELDRIIEKGSTLKLTKYHITFNLVSDSATAGEVLNVKIFDPSVVNSLVFCNLGPSKSSIPIGNDISKQVTIQTIDASMLVVNSLRQSFDYSITNKNGELVNVRSVQLFFELFHPEINY